MVLQRTSGMIQTSVLISPHLNELRNKHHITLSEAMRVGITMILAEREIGDYDNTLNVMRKMQRIQLLLTEKSQELEALKSKHGIQE